MPELFDPLDPEWLKNKFAYYAQLRTSQPVYWSEKYKMFVLTRYEDVKSALKNSILFSSASGNLIIESSHRFGQTLGASDNPTHDILKSVVKDAYGKEQVYRALQSTTVTIAGDMAASTEYDSARFTAALLNLPVDIEVVTKLIVAIQRKSPQSVLGGIDSTPSELFKQIVATAGVPTGAGIYEAYFHTGKKYLSLMTGPTLSGTTSTTGALQFMLLDLANNPEQYQLLQENKTLIPQAVSEALRYSTSTGRFSRTLTEAAVISGVLLPKGSRVALCLDAANRDPSAFTEPDTFDIQRVNTNTPLSFGCGLHTCIALFLTTAFLEHYLRNFLGSVASFRVFPQNPDRRVMCAGNFDMLNAFALI